MIETLPAKEIPGHVPSGLGNEGHPMRLMTRRVAGLEAGHWDGRARRDVTLLFDELAGEWHTRVSSQRTAVVEDALRRGLDRLDGMSDLAIEVGSGIGTYSSLFAERFRTVLSVDLSLEMLVRAGQSTPRVRADGGRLPVRDDSADAIVLINAFAFPDEIARVLPSGGRVLWVNSSGSQTPIYLSTEDLVRALPFEVIGLESRAGAGTWCALKRL